MKFWKGAAALLAVGAVAFGGSVAGTNYVLDSREEAQLGTQQELLDAQERIQIVPGVDDSVEAAANAPEVRDNIGTYTVRCQVHEGDEDGELLGFVFGNHHEDVETAVHTAETFLSRVAPEGNGDLSHCRTWEKYSSVGAYDATGRAV
ncbi:MAG: hypothetical protein ACTIA3_11140 [Corynebacterium casei]|uniref:hypothetical protein n=1 Tax=Corynebacterium TaxID=1716 RepID=UPI0026477EC7|nr:MULTISPECIES: hypothetical protein [Corynebacterium]MDN6138128.1 hypothetical protein [Corynebacterium sp.]MDN6341904.1 hypothetical protein [Corynebacterium casei]